MNKLFFAVLAIMLAAVLLARGQQSNPTKANPLVAKSVADTLMVHGRVTDKTGQGIPSVMVLAKDSKTSGLTDVNGNYRLILSKSSKTLVFSQIGYITIEKAIDKQHTINVTLKEDARQLNETVVVAYGTKRVLTGRVSGVAVTKRRANAPSKSGKYEAVPDLSGLEGGTGTEPAQNIVKNKVFTYVERIPVFRAPENRESYSKIQENSFHSARQEPLSTFSIDVDAASYANVRRFLNQGQRPPRDAVRIEEMVNYFTYDYPQSTGTEPFSVTTELAACPWNPQHQLVHIGLQGRKVETQNLPPANLVFLIDVSGSMMNADKLPLVQASLRLLVKELRPQDKVAMVVYAGAAGLVLPPTSGAQREKILGAIDQLQAGGSTAGGAGLRLAYRVAREQFQKGGNNRVILATDGDFNVGEQSNDAMEQLVTQERESGVFLTVLGVGEGNLQDSKMELLADKGNGNYAYLDNLDEAHRVLVRQFGGTLFTIAKDVKLQLEFNPARVQQYRLIGYENRTLAAEDFNNDRKDAGELGSGHTVTALYEVVPVGAPPVVDKLKYQPTATVTSGANSADVMTVKLRYKEPQGTTSRLLERSLRGTANPIDKASENLRFAAAVAQFGMLLRQSDYLGSATYANTINLASGARGKDPEGYRAELVRLVKMAEGLRPDAQVYGAR
ncbi:vWA domain-containing protein [Hymenobacter sp. GOD-10R]|uniref:vWA domain-containing protein n=1 Tax=Hymenobacter sp. GOD-10R TaxID=3093922 RepID=UPI002D79FB02|nr:von Willebrand factor type A domain-containing protein [Hymenobacter sp. GOD-10R]WRQ28630.1 von Willebrand factor type A domain-containing protein [Hymenobacter sp. GOD-10R]